MRKSRKIMAAAAAITMVFSGVNMTSFAENEKAVSTLKGDADLNGTVDLADLTTVAKYNLSNESYPLANDTAYANADMNDDGEVNGLDTSALIENQLGKEYIEPAASDKTIELTAGLQPYSIQTSKPGAKFENSQINFALSLLKNTMEDDTNNLVSGYSAAQALAMTANGAQKNTLNEMMNVIGGGMDIGSFNESMASFRKDQPNDENCKLLTANSIWYLNNENRFRIDKSFLLKNKSYYDAQIYSAPMDDSTVKEVNSWVNEHTDKMIPEIIKKFDPKTIMALVNAVTFDAKWAVPYDECYNRKNFFKSSDGSKQDAEVLTETESMDYLSDKDATGFLKYYDGGRYAFAAILPNEGTSLSDYVNSLTADKFSSLLKNAKYTTVETQMPKFTVDYDNSFVDILKSMGIKDAFDGLKADFSKMGMSPLGNNICISDVIQKTHIDVDESGTKAAAATIVVMTECTAIMQPKNPEKVTLDRPFLYAIVDTETNNPIFMGTLNSLE